VNSELESVAGDVAAETTEKPKLNLTVRVDKVSACQRHVTVSIPREDIDRYCQEKFDELAPTADVPGFRVGRAPRRLIESRFRKQVIDQVKGALLVDSLAQVNDEQDFYAISEPDLDYEAVAVPDDGPMTFEFDIEVRPEFELPQWKGLQLERLEVSNFDDALEREVATVLKREAPLVPVDGPAQAGDTLAVSLTSRHNGNVLNRQEDIAIELKNKLSLADAMVENFDQLMKDVRAGERRTIEVEVQHTAAHGDSRGQGLEGQSVELVIEVLDVKRRDTTNPAALVTQMGIESVDQLRDWLRSRLEQRVEYERRQNLRRQISQLLTESAEWDLPADLLRRQSRRELERTVIEMRSSGFSDEMIQAHENRLRHNVLERTKTLLKEHFILERIAEEEKLEDTPEDFDREIERIASQRNDSPRRVRARLERTGQMDSLRNMIIEQKAIDLITANATFKTVSRELVHAADTMAIDFFVTGKEAADIPEAKYDDLPPESTAPNQDRRDHS
jgi:trigger factor